VRIDIWSDLVCPWCYVGKRRFERALAQLPNGNDIQVVHRSFQLNPVLQKGKTINRREMLKSKYGWSEPEAESMDTRMEQTAGAEGLEYHLGATGVTGNTGDAHRLTHLALERGIQDAVVERFFRAYFTEQRSLFDPDSLVELASEAGLDPAEIRRVLQGSAYADAVAADVQEAKTLGVNGVPFFVIGKRYGVSGAQPTELFIDVITRARTESSHRDHV
jgi:predicted DsbA family dithiol-disulfide isomerase